MSKTTTETAPSPESPTKPTVAPRPPIGWPVAFFDANDTRARPLTGRVVETGDRCLSINVDYPGQTEFRQSVYHCRDEWHTRNTENSTMFGGWDWLPDWGPEVLELHRKAGKLLALLK